MTRSFAALALLAVVSAGCSRPQPEARKEGATAQAEGHGALPFIDDDYPRALAEAKKRGVPLFVDAWAPWCHTCLSLRAYVLSDPSMADLAGRFVWLAIDTEKEKNAAFVAKFPMEAWPTLFVLDPSREAPVVKWPGSLTAPELRALLDDAEGAVRRKDAGGEAGAKLLEAEQAVAAGNREAATAAYRASLSAAPPGWAKRARAVDGLQTLLARAKDHEGCARLGASELLSLPRATSAANVALTWLSCARELPGEAGKAEAARAALEVERLAGDPGLSVLADDRSSLYEELVDFRKEAGDAEGAKRAAEAWARFLDDQAKSAKSAQERAVFDAHRQLAYAALGDPARSLPMLEQTAREAPGDYNPPARLAKAYLDLKRYDEALAQADRALSLAYGPRRLRLFSLKASILAAKGDNAAAIAALDEGVKVGESSPLPGSYARQLEGLKKKRAEMAAGAR